jgi:hypothetical protein
MSHMARFDHAFPMAAMVSTLSAKRFRHIEQLAAPFLKFPMVALPAVPHMSANGEDEKEAARLFYVGATKVTHRLLVGVGGNGDFGLHTFTCHDFTT